MSTVYSIAKHASAGGQARAAKLDAATRAQIARLGGLAAQAKLDAAGRQALGHAGLRELARRHFGGDVAAARAWLVARGLFEQDPGRGTAWSLYPDPGPPGAPGA